MHFLRLCQTPLHCTAPWASEGGSLKLRRGQKLGPRDTEKNEHSGYVHASISSSSHAALQLLLLSATHCMSLSSSSLCFALWKWAAQHTTAHHTSANPTGRLSRQDNYTKMDEYWTMPNSTALLCAFSLAVLSCNGCTASACCSTSHLCFALVERAAQIQHCRSIANGMGDVAAPAGQTEAVLAGCTAHVLAGKLLKADHALQSDKQLQGPHTQRQGTYRQTYESTVTQQAATPQ